MIGLGRVLASTRRRAAALGAAAIALLLLAASPGELAPAAARGAAVVIALAAAAVLVRRRARPDAGAEALRVVASRALARDAGLALVEVSGRRVLVGYGAEGVRLVSEIGAPPDRGGR